MAMVWRTSACAEELWRREALPPVSFMALMALFIEERALDMSASSASYFAFSSAQRAFVFCKSAAKLSCFALRSLYSVESVFLDWVLSAMSADKLSMLSLPVLMAEDLVA